MLEAKQKRAQVARQKIFEAAQQLFQDKGFDETGTEEIAKAAGVAKGTVFAHFGDKLNLLAEVGLVEMKERVLYLEKHAEGSSVPKKPVETLSKGLEALLDYFEQQPEFLRVFVEESALSKREVDRGFYEIIARLHAGLKAIIEKCLKKQVIRECDPELTATALRAYMLHMAVGRMCGEYPDVKSRKAELRALVGGLIE